MRYFMTLAYRGTNYCGWQKQPNGLSVQQVLTDALCVVLREPVTVVAAGRTDAGVHASKMVVHCDVVSPIDDVSRCVAHINGLLPADIVVYDIQPVADTLHARFDAVARRYEYHVLLHKSPFALDLAWSLPFVPDFEAMNAAAAVLPEYNDFTTFSKTHTDAKTRICTITDAHWEQRGEYEWVFCIEANRFLRNMVRAVVGTLIEVGKGKMSLDEFRRAIEARNRCAAGMSVPACGLYLVDVKY
ncbi:MAG: tRNA pseudouridine(38-40) synthase TruA [Paludibacteraceae bacterium]